MSQSTRPHHPPARALRAALILSTSVVVLAQAFSTAAQSMSEDGKDSATATAGSQGFALKSEGDPPAFVLKLMGTVQADGRVYFGDRQRDNVLLRRVRPILAGTVLGLVDFYLMPDFGGGQTLLFDAYLDAHPYPWLRLRAGKFKAPIGLERLQADYDLPLPERALTSNLVPVRDLGVMLWGEIAGGIATYALGVLDGAPDNGMVDQDIGGDKDLAARILLQPLKTAPELGALGVGIAATTGGRNGSAKATSLVGYKSVGQNPLFSYLAPASDPMGTGTVFASGRETRVNPELYYYFGPFGLLGEYVWTRRELRKDTTRATLRDHAWHATASYVISGKNGYGGATPFEAWDPKGRHLGALEVALRYGVIAFDDLAFSDLADPSVSAQNAQSVGAAVNWVPSRLLRLGAQFEHTSFEGGAGKKGAIADRKPENFFVTRAQLNF